MTAKTNVLIALENILKRNSSILTPIFRSNGSANAAGDSLEYFIKDMFCTGASQYQYENEKQKIYDQYLSWSGDSSHFPDFIIRGGVGVEPKKMNNKSFSSMALNSSFPKDYIYPDSQNVPKKKLLKEEEEWSKREVVYVAGNLNNKTNKLFSLWMVYGNTFIADKSIYENLITEIREAVAETNATLKESKELARAIGIDPLKHSNLRVRGMYELHHPAIVFGEYIENTHFPQDSTQIFLVILKKDLEVLELEKETPDFNEFYKKDQLIKKEIFLPDPNDPSKSLEAVIFCGYTD
ncbi:NgoPII family restriction endonuclease [Enterococcus hirae]|nr:NgoPII family restriction endonuclease [Enterococcus hirae]EMF0231833.1 NgoPII family restriction endonuclease [Enterococcus hirae]